MSFLRKITVSIAVAFCLLYLFMVHKQSSIPFTNTTHDVGDIKPPEELKNDVTNRLNYPPYTKTDNSESSLNPTDPTPKKRYAIILNCEGRSGSTWLSSFFWRNPNVFYVYEPLFPMSSNKRIYQSNGWHDNEGHIKQLTDGFQCKLRYPHETIFPDVIGRYPKYQPELKHCEESGSCPESLTEFCQSRSHMVQKVIRVTDMRDYQKLISSLNMPVKIIHLVRDPRPHIISREKVFTYMINEDGPKYNNLSPEQKSDERRKLCQRELDNIKIGDSSIFDSSTYIRLSHEEMSLHPITWAKRLYDFVGLEFTEETEEYLLEITKGGSLIKGGKDPDGRFSGFSVYRDTLTVLHKWKKESRDHVHEIENECSELLDYLGYVKIYNDKLELIAQDPWPKLERPGS